MMIPILFIRWYSMMIVLLLFWWLFSDDDSMILKLFHLEVIQPVFIDGILFILLMIIRLILIEGDTLVFWPIPSFPINPFYSCEGPDDWLFRGSSDDVLILSLMIFYRYSIDIVEVFIQLIIRYSIPWFDRYSIDGVMIRYYSIDDDRWFGDQLPFPLIRWWYIIRLFDSIQWSFDDDLIFRWWWRHSDWHCPRFYRFWPFLRFWPFYSDTFIR